MPTIDQYKQEYSAPGQLTQEQIDKRRFENDTFMGYNAPKSPDQIPGYEKLTRFERWTMDKLPGFADSGVGKVLTRFNESWAGKALQVLDIGAEGVERVGGLVGQIATADENGRREIYSNLGAAWQASSLAADFANIPKFDPETGRLTLYHDMPGMAGVARARKRIMGGESLEVVRETMYNDMGVMALRAQINDAMLHMIGDPLTYVMPLIKPVELLNTKRVMLLAAKGLPSHLDETLAGVNRLSEIAGRLDDVPDLAKAIGRLEDVAPDEAQKLLNILPDLKDASKQGLLDELGALQKSYEGFGKLTPAEQKFLRWTGGIPGEKAPKGFLRNFFALSPQARATEYVEQIVRNIGETLIPRSAAPEQLVRSIQRAVDGTLSPQFGHMIVRPEGRIVKGVLQNISAKANDALGLWQETSSLERPMLNLMSEALGETTHSIMDQLKNGESAALLQRFIQKATENELTEQLDELLAINGMIPEQLTPEFLDGVAAIFKDIDLYDQDLFNYSILNMAVDAAKEQAVLTFGVKQQGYINQVADTVKAAETLAFLRLNPTYPIKNFINNTATMVARGTFTLDIATSAITKGQIAKFWDEVLGFVPARAGQGFTAAELAQETVAGATDLSSAFMRGTEHIAGVVKGERGWLGKMQDKISNVSITNITGKGEKGWDFGKVAQNIESMASQRAMISGYQRGWRQFWKSGTGFQKIADYDPELAASLGDDLARIIESAVGNAMNEGQLRKAIFDDNIAMNFGSIVSDAERQLGRELGTVLPEEFIAGIQDDVIEAAIRGEAELNEAMAKVSSKMQREIDTAVDEVIDVMADEAAALVETEGPGGLAKVWGEVVDDLYGTQEAHAMQTSRIVADIRAGTDPAITHARWGAYKDRTSRYYTRFWNRQEARFKGLSRAAKKANVAGADEMVGAFKQMRREWKGFFRKRNSLWDKYHEAVLAGKKPKLSADEIITQLDEAYEKAILLEDNLSRSMDNTLIKMAPEDSRSVLSAVREKSADLRLKDKQAVIEFRKSIRGVSQDQIEELYQAHWKDRINRYSEMWQVDKTGAAAIMGNPNAAATFDNTPLGQARRIASQHIPVARGSIQDGFKGYADDHIINVVNKYLRGGYDEAAGVGIADEAFDIAEEASDVPQFGSLQELLEDPSGIGLVDEAFSARSGIVPGEQATGAFLPNFNDLVKKEMYLGVGMDQLMYQRGFEALDAIKDSALSQSKKPPLRFADLPDDAQKTLRNYVTVAEGQMADTRHASLRFAEYTRDSALLNYNRKTNFDTYLGTLMPYEFWATHSIFNWALHSIDRPAMLSTYFRMKKFMETGFRPESGFPSRLKGKMRIHLPFLSKKFGDWMGNDVYIDPLSAALPIENFLRPLEEHRQQNMRDLGATTRVLEELFNDQLITAEEYQVALETQTGPTWDRAAALAQQDDGEERLNGFDFMNMLTSAHAPLMWAYNKARDKEEDIGPFLPMTRTIKGVTAMLGIGPNGGVNIEGAIRKELGLHPFDKWEDYRAERMMVNMIATKESVNGVLVTSEIVRRAMIDHKGPVWEEAVRRAGIEYGVSAMGSLIGLPTKAYPEGEEIVREKSVSYQKAWELYEMGDLDAVNRFIDENPDYEARLALFKAPEERVNRFMVDQIWDTYNDLPSLDKREAREQLGDEFVRAFLNKETRSTDSLPPELLGVWLKMLGGEPVGTLGNEAIPIQFAPPEISQVAQFFYDYRSQTYPDFYKQQQEYFRLEPGAARRQYKNKHPDFADYMAFRWDFLKKNPTVAPYLTDNPPKYSSLDAFEQAMQQEPQIAYPQLEAHLVKQIGIEVIADLQAYGLVGVVSSDLDKIITSLAENTGMTEEELEQIITGYYAGLQ